MKITIEEAEIPWHRGHTPDVIKLIPPIVPMNANGKLFLDKYYKRVYAKAVVTMFDDDCTIGSCKCSNCNSNIDISSKFCSNCGAKISEKFEVMAGDSNA